jgi:hypothetical protein
MTSGPLPPNPSELLGSERMKHLMKDLASKADVVLYDTPPALPVTDAAVLSARTDAVLMVTEAGRTRKGALQRALDQLGQVGAPLVGFALNRVARRGRKGYYYYYYYYSMDEQGRRVRRRKQKRHWDPLKDPRLAMAPQGQEEAEPVEMGARPVPGQEARPPQVASKPTGAKGAGAPQAGAREMPGQEAHPPPVTLQAASSPEAGPPGVTPEAREKEVAAEEALAVPKAIPQADEPEGVEAGAIAEEGISARGTAPEARVSEGAGPPEVGPPEVGPEERGPVEPGPQEPRPPQVAQPKPGAPDVGQKGFAREEESSARPPTEASHTTDQTRGAQQQPGQSKVGQPEAGQASVPWGNTRPEAETPEKGEARGRTARATAPIWVPVERTPPKESTTGDARPVESEQPQIGPQGEGQPEVGQPEVGQPGVAWHEARRVEEKEPEALEAPAQPSGTEPPEVGQPKDGPAQGAAAEERRWFLWWRRDESAVEPDEPPEKTADRQRREREHRYEPPAWVLGEAVEGDDE